MLFILIRFFIGCVAQKVKYINIGRDIIRKDYIVKRIANKAVSRAKPMIPNNKRKVAAVFENPRPAKKHKVAAPRPAKKQKTREET